MSRYTRWLRKQAKAQAADQVQGFEQSGGTAVLDRPRPAGPKMGRNPRSSRFEPAEPRERPQPAEPVASEDSRPQELPTCATDPLVPPVNAEPPSTPSPARRVIPGRDLAPETRRGHRRQPFNSGWLWRNKILMGDLAVIVGEQGAGKTRLLTDWIARVTSGQAFPGSDDPSHAQPPSDVLVFNCADGFQQEVLDQVAAQGGDPDRVLQATTQLLDWGHSHSEFPEGPLPQPGEDGHEMPETRVRLHTKKMVDELFQFLVRRPSIRLVVIDQLKQHLRSDSERVFEELLYDLMAVARQTEVAFVLTQRPDAYRKGTGLKQYFKSHAIPGSARAIWRIAPPEDPAHGHRVLECLKLNHGFNDSGQEPWRLWQEPGQPLRWEQGTGQEFRLGKLDAHDRLLFHAKTFISLYLRMFGGLADFETLLACARREGITGSKLMEASIVYDFGYTFEACPESEIGIRKVIGDWDQIRKRQAIPEPERPPVIGPPIPKRRKKPTPPAATTAVGIQVPVTVNTTSTATNPAAETPPPAPRPRPTPAQALESLRARVARGEARLREFNLEGFRFMKPNLAVCHLLLSLEAELGSEEAMVDQLRRGLIEQNQHSADDLATHIAEFRRLFQIAKQIEAESDQKTAA